MGIFGWSYPAGCESTPYDEDQYCDVCGQQEDHCICPECHVCGEVGNPDCYKLSSEAYGHCLTRSSLQIHSHNQAEIDYVMADWYEYISGAWI